MTRHLALLLAVTVLATPTVARACTCGEHTPLLSRDHVAENAALVFEDVCGGDPISIRVTVDGVEVTPRFEPLLRTDHAYPVWLDPPPRAGQQVFVRNDGVFHSEAWTLRVVGPDTVAPEVADISFIVYDPDADSCNYSPAAGLDVAVTNLPIDDSVVMHRITWLADGIVADLESLAPDDYDDGAIRFLRVLDAEDPRSNAAEICAELQSIDAAGNRSDTISTCEPGPALIRRGCTCASGGSRGWIGLVSATAVAARRRRRRQPPGAANSQASPSATRRR